MDIFVPEVESYLGFILCEIAYVQIKKKFCVVQEKSPKNLLEMRKCFNHYF